MAQRLENNFPWLNLSIEILHFGTKEIEVTVKGFLSAL